MGASTREANLVEVGDASCDLNLLMIMLRQVSNCRWRHRPRRGLCRACRTIPGPGKNPEDRFSATSKLTWRLDAFPLRFPVRDCLNEHTIHRHVALCVRFTRESGRASRVPRPSARAWEGRDEGSFSSTAPKLRRFTPGETGLRARTLRAAPGGGGFREGARGAAPTPAGRLRRQGCWCRRCRATWNRGWRPGASFHAARGHPHLSARERRPLLLRGGRSARWPQTAANRCPMHPVGRGGGDGGRWPWSRWPRPTPASP